MLHSKSRLNYGLLLICLMGAARTTLAANLYVATNGSDTNDGSVRHPFASLQRARDAVRGLKATGPVTVYVRGGLYPLDKTLALGAEDSGSEKSPIVYQAYRNEKATIIGGRRITGFRPYKGQILQADVGAQGFKDIYFRQLFFNGKRQQLARYPNFDPANPYGGGWAYVAGQPIPMYSDVPNESRRTLMFRPQDVHQWAHPEEGEVMVFPRFNWWNNIIPIASIDRDKNVMTLTQDASYGIRAGDRYYVRNLFEELDAPGEWYLDRRTWTLYFWPPADINNSTVYAPTLETLIAMNGVSNVEWRGFTFECCDGTGLKLTNCSNCLVSGNTIRNVGGRADWNITAVAVDGGAHDGVVGNDIYEVGGNAIALSGGDRTTLTPAGHYADNNYIHHTGVFFKQGVGVNVTGVGNRVAHNLIHDCPRFAISWSGNDHVFEYNHIRHIDLETEDTGAIYSWDVDWTMRGTQMRYNYIHDVLGYGRDNGKWVSPHFSWGFYLDDGTCGVHVYGNIVARAALGGTHIHGGRDNVIENNIFIDGTRQQMTYSGYTEKEPHFPEMKEKYQKTMNPAYNKYPGLANMDLATGYQMAGNKFLRNIIYYHDPNAKLYAMYHLPFDKTQSDFNIIQHFGQPLRVDLNNVPADKQWDEWKKLGFEQHSLLADPLFNDAAKDDYRLRPNSPALVLGFKPIPIEQVGPYRDARRASWPIIEAEGAREKPLVSEAPAH
ncbi:MAG: right-handed parallel beta-helix repeat-containing protein [Abitibacteriaceae bacterium]|nr:right-handed parallel beta-helix repeat-containing protein [Abditibacteriaceae bacterium]